MRQFAVLSLCGALVPGLANPSEAELRFEVQALVERGELSASEGLEISSMASEPRSACAFIELYTGNAPLVCQQRRSRAQGMAALSVWTDAQSNASEREQFRLSHAYGPWRISSETDLDTLALVRRLGVYDGLGAAFEVGNVSLAMDDGVLDYRPPQFLGTAAQSSWWNGRAGRSNAVALRLGPESGSRMHALVTSRFADSTLTLLESMAALRWHWMAPYQTRLTIGFDETRLDTNRHFFGHMGLGWSKQFMASALANGEAWAAGAKLEQRGSTWFARWNGRIVSEHFSHPFLYLPLGLLDTTDAWRYQRGGQSQSQLDAGMSVANVKAQFRQWMALDDEHLRAHRSEFRVDLDTSVWRFGGRWRWRGVDQDTLSADAHLGIHGVAWSALLSSRVYSSTTETPWPVELVLDHQRAGSGHQLNLRWMERERQLWSLAQTISLREGLGLQTQLRWESTSYTNWQKLNIWLCSSLEW